MLNLTSTDICLLLVTHQAWRVMETEAKVTGVSLSCLIRTSELTQTATLETLRVVLVPRSCVSPEMRFHFNWHQNPSLQ